MRITLKAAIFAGLAGLSAATPEILMIPSLSQALAQEPVEGQAAPLTIAGYQAFAPRDGAFNMPNDGKAFVVGVPTRVWQDILAEGYQCGLLKIERLMREHGLRARPRRRGLPKDQGERSLIADNVLDRQLSTHINVSHGVDHGAARAPGACLRF